MRDAIYARLSRDDPQGERVSVASQIEECRRWSTAHGGIVVDLHRDDGLSGTLPPERRPGLAGALRAAREGTIDRLLVYATSRLARREPLYWHLVYILEECGVTLASVREADASMVERLIGTWADAEHVRRTSAAVKRTIRYKQERGERWGKTLTGYRWEGKSRLEIDAATAPGVREMFWRADPAGGNWPFDQIAAAMGLRCSESIKDRLRNSGYIGIYSRDSILIPDHHPMLIDRAQWDRVQARLEANAVSCGQGGNQGRAVLALSGLLRCDYCGATLRASHKHRYRDGSSAWSYRCQHKGCEGIGQHLTRGWTADLLRLLIGHLAQAGLAEAIHGWLLESHKAARQTGQLEGEATALAQRVANLEEAIASGTLADVRGLTVKLAEAQTSERLLQSRLAAQRQASRPPALAEVQGRLSAYCDQLRSLGGAVDLTARPVLHAVVERIPITRNLDATVYLRDLFRCQRPLVPGNLAGVILWQPPLRIAA